MAIATASDYRAYIGSTDSSMDAQITMMIAAIQSNMEHYCGRLFDSATRTEYHDGLDSPFLVVENAPITAITSIKLVDGSGTLYTYPSTTYTYDTDERGRIQLRNSGDVIFLSPTYDDYISADFGKAPRFPRGARNIEVVYTGGYTSNTMPADLKQTLYRLITMERATIKKDPSLTGETLGSYSYQRQASKSGGSSIDDVAASMLRQHRRGTL